MLRFRTPATIKETCLMTDFLLNSLDWDDLELDGTATGICLNSTKTNIIGANFEMGNITLFIDPAKSKNPVYIERIYMDDNEELQIEHIAIFDMNPRDVEKLLDFEEDFYRYRQKMTI